MIKNCYGKCVFCFTKKEEKKIAIKYRIKSAPRCRSLGDIDDNILTFIIPYINTNAQYNQNAKKVIIIPHSTGK